MSSTATPPEPDYSKLRNLVLVCCHSTYTGTDQYLEEDEWILADFQKADEASGKPSEIHTYCQHILAGHAACKANASSLLMFSGGYTATKDRSEAEGYATVYREMLDSSIRGNEPPVPYALEELATDSYQNLLFSIIRFHQLTSRWPERVTVITHAFKQRRFLKLHAHAIKWPSDRLRLRGIDPPLTHEQLQETQKLERENAYARFEEDIYGVRPPLSDKRKSRGWDPAVARKLSSEDETVKRFIYWNGGESGTEIFPDRLPWE